MKKTFWEYADRLSKPENWTNELKYVHQTRLILGFILGFIAGLLYGTI